MFRFGPFRLDRRQGGLFRQEEGGKPVPIDIGSRACDILGVLLERHGEVVGKDEIMAAVWPGLVVTDANLTVHVSALRRVLGAGESETGWIQTVPGRGYRLFGSVVRSPGTLPAIAVPRESTVLPSDAASTAASTPRPWVGRTAPLQAFSRRLSQARAGRRQVVFVTGEAGIGKTTLIDMATEGLSRQGVGLLWGRCAEVFGAEEAFLPLIDALAEACRGAEGGRVFETLRDHAPTWLLQLPGLLDARDRAAMQTEIFGATRERMFREFCDLLEARSARNARGSS